MSSLIRRLIAPDPARSGDPLSLDTWAQYFSFNGSSYPFGLGSGNYTLGGKTDEINQDFAGFVHAAYRFNGVVFACMLARLMLFSEARFQFRTIRNGRPGDLFGTGALQILETPWQNATTGDLLTRMLQDVDIGGNSYTARRGRARDPRTGRVIASGEDRLRRLRPDWVTILGGSQSDPTGDFTLPDVDILGYLYHPGGHRSGNDPIVYSVDEVAHFAPIPDPCSNWIGMSWLTPILREVQADSAAMTHKLKFYEQGATPNMVVSLDPAINRENFDKWVAKFKLNHEGAMNAYKTLFLGGGATMNVVGSNMKQLDFSATQGHGETRIASAAGVPPIIVGLSEGLAAATYSNYGQARRAFSDITMRPLWRNASGSLATLVDVPRAAELWYDARDIAFLAEDQKDSAEIQSIQAQSIHTLVTAGYEPDSAQAAVLANDLSLLTHSGMYSVQLIPPGFHEATTKNAIPADAGTAPAVAGLNDVGRVLRALLTQN